MRSIVKCKDLTPAMGRREFLAVLGMLPLAAGARAGARERFREMRFGLFVHYGLASLLPGGKLRPRPAGVTDAELQRQFTAAAFDADAIAELAVAAGMRYVNFTPYHGGGPFNWRSRVAHPNTFDDLPAHRDLVGELATACAKRNLAFFLYVHASLAQSHDAVWPRNRAIFAEWLDQHGPIAGFWFDTDSAYYKDKDRKLYLRLAELYALIRARQPDALISFCHGVTGDEDFVTLEHRFRPLSDFPFVPEGIRSRLAGRPVEVCTTMQLQERGGKGTKMWFNVDGAYHRTADEVWAELAAAGRDGCNLLLNVGPRGDGSIHPDDEAALREVGRRIRREGYPKAALAVGPSASNSEEDR